MSLEDCMARPEVRAYMERVRTRMLARWALPPEVPGNQSVQLRFVLDPAGTASRVELARLGRVIGEDRLGPRTRTALGSGEGLLFGAFLAAGLTRRPRHGTES